MFKRLRYLIAEGFEICSIQGEDSDQERNGKIVFRLRNEKGEWRIRTEEVRVGARESEASAELFIDYLQSKGAG